MDNLLVLRIYLSPVPHQDRGEALWGDTGQGLPSWTLLNRQEATGLKTTQAAPRRAIYKASPPMWYGMGWPGQAAFCCAQLPVPLPASLSAGTENSTASAASRSRQCGAL